MIKEKWLPIPFAKGYEVSNLGSVRSFRRSIRMGYGFGTKSVIVKEPRSLRLYNNRGYLYVKLSGVRSPSSISRLVLLAFVGPCLIGEQCAHLDGDKLNNKLTNLAWMSAKENNSHKLMHGTAQKGERASRAKLNNNSIKQIKALKATGIYSKVIAKSFGVTPSTIDKIIRGESWSHVV